MTSTRKPVVSATTPTVPLVDNKSGQISWAWLKWFQGLGAAVNAALNQDGGLNPPTLTTLGGVFEADSVPHEFLTEIDNTGQPHGAQPAFTDISGIIAPSQLPDPTTGSLGGVEANAPVAHKWLNAINTSGIPQLSQPAFSDISGIAAKGQLGTGTPAGGDYVDGGTDAWTALPFQTLTTTGTSGPATLLGTVLNVPQYAGGGTGGVSGSGTTGYFPEWMGPTALGNSPFDDGVTLAGTVSSSEPIAAPSEAIGAFLTSAGLSVFGETLDVFSSVPGGIQAVFWGMQDPTNSNDFSVAIPMWGYVPGSPGTLGNDFAGFGYSGTIDNAGNVTVAYMYFQSSLANGFDNILIDQAGDVGIGGSAMNNASINPQDGVLYIPVTGPAKFTRPLQSTGRVKNLNIQTISYTILAIDEIVQMNAAGATTVTLDNTVPASGQVFAIKNVGAGTCTVQPSSGNIDNHASLALTQWQGMEVYWDGTLWRVLSQALSV